MMWLKSAGIVRSLAIALSISSLMVCSSAVAVPGLEALTEGAADLGGRAQGGSAGLAASEVDPIFWKFLRELNARVQADGIPGDLLRRGTFARGRSELTGQEVVVFSVPKVPREYDEYSYRSYVGGLYFFDPQTGASLSSPPVKAAWLTPSGSLIDQFYLENERVLEVRKYRFSISRTHRFYYELVEPNAAVHPALVQRLAKARDRERETQLRSVLLFLKNHEPEKAEILQRSLGQLVAAKQILEGDLERGSMYPAKSLFSGLTHLAFESADGRLFFLGSDGAWLDPPSSRRDDAGNPMADVYQLGEQRLIGVRPDGNGGWEQRDVARFNAVTGRRIPQPELIFVGEKVFSPGASAKSCSTVMDSVPTPPTE